MATLTARGTDVILAQTEGFTWIQYKEDFSLARTLHADREMYLDWNAGRRPSPGATRWPKVGPHLLADPWIQQALSKLASRQPKDEITARRQAKAPVDLDTKRKARKAR